MPFKVTKSNWELIIYCIISEIIDKNSLFYRQDMITSYYIELSVKFSEVLGHKKKPKHPLETIQRTLQKMRDNGFIDFHGNGEYKLTKNGKEEMKNNLDQGLSYWEVLKKPLMQK